MSLQKNITFKQLRAFKAVLKTGSVTRAAEELCVTPPAVSIQVKTLEGLVGAKILQRGENGFQATDTGLEIATLSERVEAAIETSAKKLDALKTGKAGSLGIGVVSTGKYFAPAILAAFLRSFPDIDLRLVIGGREEITRALASRAVDLAILGRPPVSLSVAHDYLGDHPYGIVVAQDHPLADLDTVPAAKLLQETFLMREAGSGTRALAQRYLDQYGSGQSYTSLELNSNESIKQAVMAGMGIAMLSLHTARAELQSGRLLALKAPGLPLLRKWILVHLADDPLSDAANCFRGFLLHRRQRFMLPVGE